MGFASIVLFVILYYLKPQEWSSLLAKVRFVPLVMATSILSLFMGEKSPRFRDFFRTPHDWAMYAFFAWVILASPAPFTTFGEFYNRLVFYLVIVHTLSNWPRISKFMGWWTGVIVAVAALALISEYIFDPLGSRDITHGQMKDRLILNISTVNNPNALGHSVVPVIPMLYFFCIWRRPFFMKQIGVLALVIPIWCVYLTFSKGAYVAGAMALLATLTFGRPKIIQIAVLSLALFGGVTAVQMLPRMGELKQSKTDEAIQGRVKAFTHGRQYYDTLALGVGQGRFIQSLYADFNYYKAAHSTYVQTGAELGRVGLFLFVLIMWTCARTLLFATTRTPEQERVRRTLFVLLLSYAISGWMVDFAYRPYFFMMVAAVAAFHRMLHAKPEEEVAESDDQTPALPWLNAPMTAGRNTPPPLSAPMEPVAVEVLPPVTEAELKPVKPWLRKNLQEDLPTEEAPAASPVKPWMKLGFADLVITVILLYLVERTWWHAIHAM